MRPRASLALAAACLAALALLAMAWFRLERGAAVATPSLRTVLASSVTEGTVSPLAEPERGDSAAADGVRVQAAADPRPAAPDAASAAPASVVGSLRIDGELQEHGEVELRDASGSWSCTQPLNYGAKFRFDGVPSGDLTLSFALGPGAPRRVFVARIDVGAAPGEISTLALDLRSTEVNVRVLGPGPGWSQACVEIQGPGLAGSVETDENGKCALGLVGEGRFTFTATTRSGGRGEVAVELAGGEGLESVVIPTTDSD